MENAYGLDADYFIRLFARELNPDVVRNQTPTCLARVLLRAARTASEQVFAELEFSDLFPKPAEALAGITLSAEGEANTYRMMRGGNWLASIRMNGELLVSQQEAILSAMLASPPADHSAHGLNMVGALATALDGLLSITEESEGVAGYHLNGEIAEWAEFPEVDTARDVLSLYRERDAKSSFFGIDLAEGAIKGAWRDALIAQGWAPPATEPKRLIGWRTENFLWETADIAVAQNWEPNIGVLPIFEGDPNTALAAQAVQAAGLRFVFTAMPGPGNECAFVEVENERGESISVGQWRARPDGLCELVLSAAPAQPEEV